ncbi:hypothetical protein GEMRC1_007609 [Eukaryota sp. GEM-RC1]
MYSPQIDGFLSIQHVLRTLDKKEVSTCRSFYPKKLGRTTASTSLNSSDLIDPAIVSSPYKNTVSSLPSLTASKTTCPRDVLVSETSITKPLSTEFSDILSVFDALTSVFVSLGSKPGTSITWDELQSSVQSLLNHQKVDFTLNFFRSIVALSPRILHLSFSNCLVVSTSISTSEWFTHRSSLQQYLKKRMDDAHGRYLRSKSIKKSKLISSKSKVWEVSFLENYADALPLCPLPEPRVESRDRVTHESHLIMDKINQYREKELNALSQHVDLSKIPKKLLNLPRQVLALTLQRQENSLKCKLYNIFIYFTFLWTID